MKIRQSLAVAFLTAAFLAAFSVAAGAKPQVKADYKGGARTHCARCGLPCRISFER